MMLLAVSLNAGVAIYILIYNFFFYGDGTPFDQDLRGYFLLLAASTLGLHIVVYVTYKLHDVIPVLVKDDYETLQDTNEEDELEKADEHKITRRAQNNDSNLFHSRSDSGQYSDVVLDSSPTREALEKFDEYSKLIPKTSTDDISNGSLRTVDAQENKHESKNKSVQTVLDQDEGKWKNIKCMFRSYKFHLLFWPALTITCLRLVCVTNLQTFLMSFQIDHYPQIIFYISPIISIAMKLSMSAVFHLFSNRVPRVGLVTGGAFLSMGSFILALYQMQKINVIIILVVVWTFAGGLALSLLPAIFAAQFGKETSPVSLGAIHAGKATLQLALQGLFGSLYDIQITDGGKTCYGAMCFDIFFMTGAALSGLCLVLLMGYMYFQNNTNSEKW